MIKIIFLALLLILISLSIQNEIAQTEKNVYLLTDENFQNTIASKQFILVKFYVSWCGFCKLIESDYQKIADYLIKEQANNIAVAQIDADLYPQLVEKYNVQGYPTLKLFQNGDLDNPVDYEEEFGIQNVLTWLRKKNGKVSNEIVTIEDYQNFIQKKKVSLVYIGQSKHDKQWFTFSSIAQNYHDISFYNIFNPETKLFHFKNITDNSQLTLEDIDNQKTQLVLFKKFEEPYLIYDNAFTYSQITKFLEVYAYSLVMPFNDHAIRKLFKKPYTVGIILFSIRNEQSLQAEEAFKQSAQENRGKLQFFLSHPDDGFGKFERLAEHVGIETIKSPQIIIVESKNSGEIVKKFLYTSAQVNTQEINTFIQNFLDQKLPIYYKSEDIYNNNNQPVKQYVGKDFKQQVLISENNVLVKFYAPWCGHSRQLAPIYLKIAEKFSYLKNLVFAKYDYTTNDYPGLVIKGFPTLKLYLQGRKNAPIEYEGELNEESIDSWIQQFLKGASSVKKEDL